MAVPMRSLCQLGVAKPHAAQTFVLKCPPPKADSAERERPSKEDGQSRVEGARSVPYLLHSLGASRKPGGLARQLADNGPNDKPVDPRPPRRSRCNPLCGLHHSARFGATPRTAQSPGSHAPYPSCIAAPEGPRGGRSSKVAETSHFGRVLGGLQSALP